MAHPTNWQLTSGGITVLYNSHLAQLTFLTSTGPPSHFNGAAQIRTVADPDIGTVVSVTLHVPHVTLSLVLPRVNLPAPNAVVPVSCPAIIGHHLPPGPAFGQQEFYQWLLLQGNAS